ncbi:MAG: response regulator [Nitrospira sp.]
MHRLLVIEEDAEVRRHLCEALEAEGYRVLVAADGQAGLCLFREDPADLVLLNLSISGRDSVDLIRQFHRLSRTSKIIAISGGIENWQFLTVSSYLGDHMMLQKPFSRQKLLEVVRMQLSSPR